MTAKGNLVIQVRHLRAATTLNFFLIVFFLVATASVHALDAAKEGESVFPASVTAGYILSLFNLSSENTAASWFSSMLLFQVGLFALLCYWLDRSFSDASVFKYGWFFMSLFFLLLSLDEMGSIHENAGELASLDVMGDGGWQSVVMIPLAAVLLYMGMFAFKHLRHYRLCLLLMATGMLLILTIPLHEYFEMRSWSASNYSPEWRRPLWQVLFEEGSELFAFCFFLIAMKIFISAKAGGDGFVAIPSSTVTKLIILASVLMLALAFLMYYSIDTLSADEGIAMNWFPAAMAMLCGLLTFTGAQPKIYVILFVLMSAYFGINFYALMDWREIATLRYVVLFVILTGMIVWAASQMRIERKFLRRVLVVAATIGILSSLFVTDVEITFVAFTAMAFVAGYLATQPQMNKISQ
jgi:hypothetical protein